MYREGRRRLPAAGIVEMIAGVGWAPIGKDPLQAPFREMRLGYVLGHIDEAKSGHSSGQHLKGAVEDKLALHMYP